MNDGTKKMLIAVGAGIAKKVLMLQAAGLVSHGIISANETETYVSVGFALIGAAWSFWDDYGRAIVMSQLDVLKAKSLAQAEKMKAAGVSPVTTAQIAQQSATLSTADVTKAIAKLPAENQANVAKAVLIFAVATASLFIISGGNARAQKLGPIATKIIEGGAPNSSASAAIAGIPKDLLGALDEKILPDLTYAKAMADATGSNVTAGCYAAWIEIIQSRQQALKDASGQPLALPDAHLITDFERVVELRNALQPTSKFSVACSPVANMVKKDILNFIGIVMGGGASLSLLGIGL